MSKIKIQTTAVITTDNGERIKIKLKDPEDLLNGLVPDGTEVTLILKHFKIVKGELVLIDDDNGEIVVYLCKPGTNEATHYKYDNIIAYSDGC